MSADPGNKRVRRALLPLCLAAALALTGCMGGKGNVTGEVKYNGTPLPSGQITFIGQSGEKVVVPGEIKDGKYSLANVPAGPVAITVHTVPPTRPGRRPDGTTPPAAPAGAFVKIPSKYAKPSTSGLTFEVKRGENTKNIDLAP
jgi:hypothetical protein